MSAFTKSLIAVALSQVGVRESGGNNCGKQIRIYQAATWLEVGPWPWCAAFVCWCFAQVSKDKFSRYTRLTTPRAFDLIAWGIDNGLVIDYLPSKIVAGSLIVFHFKTGYHCGIAVKDSVGDECEIVEGNTEGQGQSRDGGGVYLMTRNLSLIHAAVLPR